MRLLLAPGIWLVHFSTVYVLVSLVCSAQADGRTLFGFGFVAVGAALATVAALGAFALIARHDYRAWRTLAPGPRAFIAHTSVLLCALSALGVVWVAYPAWVLPPCAA